MTRQKFVQIYADMTGKGRAKNFPDMRPSEHAVSRVHDEEMALKVWRKHRAIFVDRSDDEVRAMLTTKS